MYGKQTPDGTEENLWDLPSVGEAQEEWIWTGARDSGASSENPLIVCLASRSGAEFLNNLPNGCRLAPQSLTLPKDRRITISVIKGPSKGLALQMVKPHISVGRSGSGADMEINDPKVSERHCAIGVKQDIIRLCDLDSESGTWIGNQRVSVAPLEHLSEFRVGSSLLLVTVYHA